MNNPDKLATTLQNTGGAIKMDNPEKLATWIHKTKKNKTQHNAKCVGHHYSQANTNNVDKTWAIPQTGCNKEPHIVLYGHKNTASDCPNGIVKYLLYLWGFALRNIIKQSENKSNISINVLKHWLWT